jgi:hypothetical protein
VRVFREHRRLVSLIGIVVILGFAVPAVLSAVSAIRSDSSSASVPDSLSRLADDYVRALRSGDPARVASLALPVEPGAGDPLDPARDEVRRFGPSARAGDVVLAVVGRSDDGSQVLLRVGFADGLARTLLVVEGPRIAGYDLRLDGAPA